MRSGRPIVVDAKPDALMLDAALTAVVVVDMQNDFGAPGAMFALAGIDIAPIRAVIPPTAVAVAAARRAGMAIIYLKMAFKPDLSDAGAHDGPTWIKHERLRIGAPLTDPHGNPSRILIRDTWNTEIVAELAPESGDIVLYKHRYSGFFETELDAVLRQRGIRNLIFAGCTTSVCVESTLRDAAFRDYRCLLLEDCTAEPGVGGINHEATVILIGHQFGWVTQSARFVEALEEQLTHSAA